MAAGNADICQLPDGQTFTGAWLAAALGVSSQQEIVFSIPEADVVRGPHSVAARLLIQKQDDAASALPDSAFVKRVVRQTRILPDS